jgi:hypothetical protein
VWVPKVRGRASHIARGAESVPDPRVRHFWDGEARLMNAYQQVLRLPEDAWDVYLVYDPGVRWEDELPPAPQFWMHQLGPPEKPRVKGIYLDVPRLARVVEASLQGGAGLGSHD